MKKRYDRAKYANSLNNLSDIELSKIKAMYAVLSSEYDNICKELSRLEAQIVATVLDMYRV